MGTFYADDFTAQPDFSAAAKSATGDAKYYAEDIDPRLAGAPPPPPDSDYKMSSGEKFWSGMGSWMTDKALGAHQRLIETRRQLPGTTDVDRARLDAVATGLEKEAREKKRIDTELNKSGWATAGKVAGNLPAAYLLGPTLAGSVLYGAGEGLTEPTTSDDSVAGNTVKGGALGVLGYGAARGIEGTLRAGSAALGLRPIIDRASRMAAAAREGVSLRLGDLTQHPGVMKLENFLSQLPFSGQSKKMGEQTGDVLDMVNRRLGESRPPSLDVPDEAAVKAMPANELRKLFPPGSSVLNLSDRALKALPYDALEHAGLRAQYSDTGDALTSLVRAGYGREKAAAKNAYDAVSKLSQATGSPPVELSNLRTAAQDALAKYPQYFESLQNQNVVRMLNDVIGSTTPKPGAIVNAQGKPLTQTASNVTFDEARDLRSILGALSRQAERQIQAGTIADAKAAGSLTQLYRAATQDLDHWGKHVADPAVGAAYKLADRTFKEGVVRFRESPSLKQVIRKDFDSDKAYQALIRPGGRNVAEDAMFALGPNERQVLEHAIMEDLVGSGTKPAVDLGRASRIGAPQVKSIAQEFDPTAFVSRARQIRDPINAVINDDAKYKTFLEQLDLINATKRGVQASLDPATGQRMIAPFAIASTHGLAIPGGRAVSAGLSSKAIQKLLSTRPLIDESTSSLLKRSLRAPPLALGLGADDQLD